MVDECPDSDLTYTESKRPHGVYVYGLLLMIQNRALRDTSSSQLPLPPHIDTPATLTKKKRHCGRSGLGGLAMVGKLGRNM